MPSARSPVIHVIVGYLGSGKTTLLRRLLSHELAAGRRVGVIVNEMADLDVDGATLHGSHGHHESLHVVGVTGGCVCCDLGEELLGALRRQLDAGPDVVFIESTGVAALPQLLENLTRVISHPETDAVVGACIGVVDAARIEEQRRRWLAAPIHLLGADVVVLNHVDEASPEALMTAGALAEAMAPTSRLLTATYADVDPGPLLAVRHKLRSLGPFDIDSLVGHSQSTFLVRKPIDLGRFEALLGRFPKSLLRLKGFVYVPGDRLPRAVQWYPGAKQVQVERFASEVEAGYLTAIGRRIDWDRFTDGLEECIAPAPKRRAQRSTMLH